MFFIQLAYRNKLGLSYIQTRKGSALNSKYKHEYNLNANNYERDE